MEIGNETSSLRFICPSTSKIYSSDQHKFIHIFDCLLFAFLVEPPYGAYFVVNCWKFVEFSHTKRRSENELNLYTQLHVFEKRKWIRCVPLQLCLSPLAWSNFIHWHAKIQQLFIAFNYRRHGILISEKIKADTTAYYAADDQNALCFCLSSLAENGDYNVKVTNIYLDLRSSS